MGHDFNLIAEPTGPEPSRAALHDPTREGADFSRIDRLTAATGLRSVG
jgi:hypothetical protein